MARIKPESVDRIVSSALLSAVIQSAGVALVKNNKDNYKACCPFHMEKTPSFHINDAKGLYHCFGCGASGNVITFCREYLNDSYSGAIERIAGVMGMTVEYEERTYNSDAERMQDQLNKKLREEDRETLADVAQVYQHQLRKHEPALAYLKRRGVSEEMIDMFRLGYAPSYVFLRNLAVQYGALFSQQLAEQAARLNLPPLDLQQVYVDGNPELNSLLAITAKDSSLPPRLAVTSTGQQVPAVFGNFNAWQSLVRTNQIQLNKRFQDVPAEGFDAEKYHDFFAQRLMFPIIDPRGNVVGFGGRIIEGDGPKYINSKNSLVYDKSRELYGLYQVVQYHNRERKKIERIVLVEGYLDVVSMMQYGVGEGVAASGTTIQPGQLTTIFKHTSKVVFCFDGDGAGRKAAYKSALTALPLLKDNYKVNVCFLPFGEDPDSFLKAFGKDKFSAFLNNGVDLVRFMLEHALAECGAVVPERIALNPDAIKLAQQVLKSYPQEYLDPNYVDPRGQAAEGEIKRAREAYALAQLEPIDLSKVELNDEQRRRFISLVSEFYYLLSHNERHEEDKGPRAIYLTEITRLTQLALQENNLENVNYIFKTLTERIREQKLAELEQQQRRERYYNQQGTYKQNRSSGASGYNNYGTGAGYNNYGSSSSGYNNQGLSSSGYNNYGSQSGKSGYGGYGSSRYGSSRYDSSSYGSSSNGYSKNAGYGSNPYNQQRETGHTHTSGYSQQGTSGYSQQGASGYNQYNRQAAGIVSPAQATTAAAAAQAATLAPGATTANSWAAASTSVGSWDEQSTSWQPAPQPLKAVADAPEEPQRIDYQPSYLLEASAKANQQRSSETSSSSYLNSASSSTHGQDSNAYASGQSTNTYANQHFDQLDSKQTYSKQESLNNPAQSHFGSAQSGNPPAGYDNHYQATNDPSQLGAGYNLPDEFISIEETMRRSAYAKEHALQEQYIPQRNPRYAKVAGRSYDRSMVKGAWRDTYVRRKDPYIPKSVLADSDGSLLSTQKLKSDYLRQQAPGPDLHKLAQMRQREQAERERKRQELKQQRERAQKIKETSLANIDLDAVMAMRETALNEAAQGTNLAYANDPSYATAGNLSGPHNEQNQAFASANQGGQDPESQRILEASGWGKFSKPMPNGASLADQAAQVQAQLGQAYQDSLHQEKIDPSLSWVKALLAAYQYVEGKEGLEVYQVLSEQHRQAIKNYKLSQEKANSSKIHPEFKKYFDPEVGEWLDFDQGNPPDGLANIETSEGWLPPYDVEHLTPQQLPYYWADLTGDTLISTWKETQKKLVALELQANAAKAQATSRQGKVKPQASIQAPMAKVVPPSATIQLPATQAAPSTAKIVFPGQDVSLFTQPAVLVKPTSEAASWSAGQVVSPENQVDTQDADEEFQVSSAGSKVANSMHQDAVVEEYDAGLAYADVGLDEFLASYEAEANIETGIEANIETGIEANIEANIEADMADNGNDELNRLSVEQAVRDALNAELSGFGMRGGGETVVVKAAEVQEAPQASPAESTQAQSPSTDWGATRQSSPNSSVNSSVGEAATQEPAGAWSAARQQPASDWSRAAEPAWSGAEQDSGTAWSTNQAADWSGAGQESKTAWSTNQAADWSGAGQNSGTSWSTNQAADWSGAGQDAGTSWSPNQAADWSGAEQNSGTAWSTNQAADWSGAEQNSGTSWSTSQAADWAATSSSPAVQTDWSVQPGQPAAQTSASWGNSNLSAEDHAALEYFQALNDAENKRAYDRAMASWSQTQPDTPHHNQTPPTPNVQATSWASAQVAEADWAVARPTVYSPEQDWQNQQWFASNPDEQAYSNHDQEWAEQAAQQAAYNAAFYGEQAYGADVYGVVEPDYTYDSQVGNDSSQPYQYQPNQAQLAQPQLVQAQHLHQPHDLSHEHNHVYSHQHSHEHKQNPPEPTSSANDPIYAQHAHHLCESNFYYHQLAWPRDSFDFGKIRVKIPAISVQMLTNSRLVDDLYLTLSQLESFVADFFRYCLKHPMQAVQAVAELPSWVEYRLVHILLFNELKAALLHINDSHLQQIEQTTQDAAERLAHKQELIDKRNELAAEYEIEQGKVQAKKAAPDRLQGLNRQLRSLSKQIEDLSRDYSAHTALLQAQVAQDVSRALQAIYKSYNLSKLFNFSELEESVEVDTVGFNPNFVSAIADKLRQALIYLQKLTDVFLVQFRTYINNVNLAIRFNECIGKILQEKRMQPPLVTLESIRTNLVRQAEGRRTTVPKIIESTYETFRQDLSVDEVVFYGLEEYDYYQVYKRYQISHFVYFINALAPKFEIFVPYFRVEGLDGKVQVDSSQERLDFCYKLKLYRGMLQHQIERFDTTNKFRANQIHRDRTITEQVLIEVGVKSGGMFNQNWG